MNHTANFKWLLTLLILCAPGIVQAKAFFPSRLTPVILQRWIAPFDGVLETPLPARGALLEVGQPIGSIQAPLLCEKIVLLQQELLRTEVALEQRMKWADSTDVLSAQMQLFQSESQMKQTCDKYNKHTPLYNKGLISDEEREAQERQCEQASRYTIVAQKQLELVLREGQPDKLEQLQRQHQLLKTQETLLLNWQHGLQGSAEVSGLWWPSEELSTEVTTSEEIGAIVDAHTWSLPIVIDEHERLNLKVGQVVQVQITSLKDQLFDGKITSLESNPSFEGSQLARYTGYVSATIPKEFDQDWFFGMRAMVIIND